MFIDEAKIAVQLKHANIAQIFELGERRRHATSSRSSTSAAGTCARCSIAAASSGDADADRAGVLHRHEGRARASTTRTTSATRTGRELHARASRRLAAERARLVRRRGQGHRLRHREGRGQGAARRRPASSRASSATCRPSRCAACRSIAAATSSRCGIVLYELLTGERLFVGESDFSTLEKVRNVEILPPSTLQPPHPRRARAHRAQGAREGRRRSLPERDRSPRRAAGVRVHRRRVLLAQGSRGLDEEDVRSRD